LLVTNVPTARVLTRAPLQFCVVTFTVTLHDPFIGIVPPVSVTFELPATAVTVPPQVLLALPETKTPVGSVSTSGAVRWAPVAAELYKVMVRSEIPPSFMEVGLNDLVSRGGAMPLAVNCMVAVAEPVLLPTLVFKAPAGMVLVRMPTKLFSVTPTTILQKPLAGIEPPVKVTFPLPGVAVTTPPQVLLAFPETNNPVGKVSVNGAVSLATVLFGLFKKMLRTDTAPSLLVKGVKYLLSVGGKYPVPLKVKVADAGEALVPLLVFKTPAGRLLVRVPKKLFSVTFTFTVQELLAGIEPPANATFELPATAVSVPPQVVLAPPETNKPAGKVSTNGAESVAALLLGFFKVMVRADTPPSATIDGLKDLLSVGVEATAVTVKVAEAGAVLLPLLVFSAPAGMVLTLPWQMQTFSATLTVTVQEPWTGIEPPVNVIVEPPVAAETVPPQVEVGVPAATIIPPGSESVSGPLSFATVPFGLFKVMVRAETAPDWMVDGLKDFASVGGTVRMAVTVKVATAGAVLLP
jgi:hypothetical protein